MGHESFERFVCLGLLLGLAGSLWGSPFMGEYEGTFHPDPKSSFPATAKVVQEGEQYHRIILYTDPKTPITEGAYVEIYAIAQGPSTVVTGRSGGYDWHGEITSGKLTARSHYGQYFELEKIESKSPRAGLVPPGNAVVLLSYKKGRTPDMSGWTNREWKALDNGSMQIVPGKGDNRTKRRFGDIKHLHIEFKLPLEPLNRGQGRANSGVYLVDRYEVQVLDSFGLTHTSGDCGGIYNVARARVNACLPPEVWQTYDITFKAPKLNADGEAKELPRITVLHNGVMIHENLEIPVKNHREKGPLQLQDHGHPIQYRNIWVVE